jgi:hypothetical protein
MSGTDDEAQERSRMRTVILEIAAPRKKKGGGFPVRLLIDQPGAPGKFEPVKAARATLTPTFDLRVPVEHPPGNALTLARVQQLYATLGDESEAYTVIGRFLFNLVAPGPIGREWARLRQSLAQADGTPGMRTILAIDNDPNLLPLRDLPWELLYDDVSALQLALEHSLVRRTDVRKVPNDEEWPLRVLVVHAVREPANRAGGAVSIAANEELDAIEALFAKARHRIEYELLEYPLPEDIESACRHIRPHVLHFIGHARDREGAGEAQLILHRPAAEGRLLANVPWSVRDIRTQLNGIAPRLVFLNACRTANAGAEVPLGTGNIADAFILAGSRAVLGMQADVPGDLARVFSESFYRELLAGRHVDEAAFAARRDMSRIRGNMSRRGEWSFPVLRAVVPPESILPVHRAVDARSWAITCIVDRVRQRRMVREAAARQPTPQLNGQDSPSLVVIRGEASSGKTYLARWCGQLNEAQLNGVTGLRHLYIDFGTDRPGVDVLDVLRWIRDGKQPVRGEQTSRAPDWLLPPEAFRDFNWALQHRMRGVSFTPRLPAGNAPISDDGMRMSDAKALPETFIPDTLQSFCLALEQAARSQPVLLTLDHLEQLDGPSVDNWLPTYLFKPVAAGAISNVRMLLVVSRYDYESRMQALADLKPAPTFVDVDHFRNTDFEWLARYLCRQWSDEIFTVLRGSLDALLESEKQKGRTLAQCLQIVDQWCQVLVRAKR